MVWVSSLGPSFIQLRLASSLQNTMWFYLSPHLHYLVLLVFAWICRIFHQYFFLVMFRICKPRFPYWLKVSVEQQNERSWKRLDFGFFFCLYMSDYYWWCCHSTHTRIFGILSISDLGLEGVTFQSLVLLAGISTYWCAILNWGTRCW